MKKIFLISSGARAHDLVKLDAAFENDERAGVRSRHFRTGQHGMRDSGVDLRSDFSARGGKAAAHPFQQTPQLRLEKDDQRDQTELGRFSQRKTDHLQAEEICQQHHEKKDDDPLCKVIGVRPPDKPYRFVDQKCHDKDVNDIGDSHCRKQVERALQCSSQCFHKGNLFVRITYYPFLSLYYIASG